MLYRATSQWHLFTVAPQLREWAAAATIPGKAVHPSEGTADSNARLHEAMVQVLTAAA